MSKVCPACNKFFKIKKYRCAQHEGAGECDCPKCQGLCLCYEIAKLEQRKIDKAKWEADKAKRKP